MRALNQDDALRRIVHNAQKSCRATFIKCVSEADVVGVEDVVGSGSLDLCRYEAALSESFGSPRTAQRLGRMGTAIVGTPVEVTFRGTQRFRQSLAPSESEPPPPSGDGRYNVGNPLWPFRILSAIVEGQCDHRYDDPESAAIALRLTRCDLEDVGLHPALHKRWPWRKPDPEIWIQVHVQHRGSLDEFRFSWSQRGRRTWFVYRYEWQPASDSADFIDTR